MAKKDYQDWDKKALIDEIDSLEKRKKYGLVWKNKPEDVVEQCKDNLPVLEEVKRLSINTAPDQATDLLIEGDNYHALSVLNYTHKKKIDVIYIDPPYNTGAKDWKYNNNFVDETDGYHHSKWLSMMANRLRLAQTLLKDDGFLIVSIDHHEIFTLGMLMDEILLEKNRLGVITVVHKPEGRNQEKFFGTSNEFMFVYAKNINKANFNNIVLDIESRIRYSEEDEKGKYREKNFIRLADGKYSLAKNKPRFFYPIYVSKDLKNFSLNKKNGYTEVLPITVRGIKRTWKTTKETFIKRANMGDIIAKKEEDKIVIFEKLREDEVIRTHWIKKEYHSYHYGTKILELILGAKKFDFPKSLHLVEDILKITTKKNSVILDFFAGSGTTGHAVSLLNKEDGGNRRFILCTNNENGIAREVCHPRIKAVIKGHPDYPDITGIPSNLKYFKTTFVAASATSPTDKNKTALTLKAAEMLCVKEGTFELVKQTATYKIFRNQNRYTGIIYKEAAINAFIKAIAKIDGKFSVYIFSFTDEDFSEWFAGTKQVVKLHPIPEVILRAYRQIFK